MGALIGEHSGQAPSDPALPGLRRGSQPRSGRGKAGAARCSPSLHGTARAQQQGKKQQQRKRSCGLRAGAWKLCTKCAGGKGCHTAPVRCFEDNTSGRWLILVASRLRPTGRLLRPATRMAGHWLLFSESSPNPAGDGAGMGLTRTWHTRRARPPLPSTPTATERRTPCVGDDGLDLRCDYCNLLTTCHRRPPQRNGCVPPKRARVRCGGQAAFSCELRCEAAAVSPLISCSRGPFEFGTGPFA